MALERHTTVLDNDFKIIANHPHTSMFSFLDDDHDHAQTLCFDTGFKKATDFDYSFLFVFENASTFLRNKKHMHVFNGDHCDENSSMIMRFRFNRLKEAFE